MGVSWSFSDFQTCSHRFSFRSSDVACCAWPFLEVPKRIDHPSAKPRKVRAVAEAMRPFALHWRCHGLAGVEATKEALEAGRAYEQMLQQGLESPYFEALRMECAWKALKSPLF